MMIRDDDDNDDGDCESESERADDDDTADPDVVVDDDLDYLAFNRFAHFAGPKLLSCFRFSFPHFVMLLCCYLVILFLVFLEFYLVSLSRSFQNISEMMPNMPQNRLQMGPKTAPKPNKISYRCRNMAQNVPICPKWASRWPQDGARWRQDRPRLPEDGPS